MGGSSDDREESTRRPITRSRLRSKERRHAHTVTRRKKGTGHMVNLTGPSQVSLLLQIRVRVELCFHFPKKM
jgi:hypothetical protein